MNLTLKLWILILPPNPRWAHTHCDPHLCVETLCGLAGPLLLVPQPLVVWLQPGQLGGQRVVLPREVWVAIQVFGQVFGCCLFLLAQNSVEKKFCSIAGTNDRELCFDLVKVAKWQFCDRSYFSSRFTGHDHNQEPSLSDPDIVYLCIPLILGWHLSTLGQISEAYLSICINYHTDRIWGRFPGPKNLLHCLPAFWLDSSSYRLFSSLLSLSSSSFLRRASDLALLASSSDLWSSELALLRSSPLFCHSSLFLTSPRPSSSSLD